MKDMIVRVISVVLLGAAVLAVLVLAAMFWPMRVEVQAQTACNSIEMDRFLIENGGGPLEYLGVRKTPFTDQMAVFYRNKDTGLTEMSRVIDGCVEVQSLPVGEYVAQPSTTIEAPVPMPRPAWHGSSLRHVGDMLSDYLELRAIMAQPEL